MDPLTAMLDPQGNRMRPCSDHAQESTAIVIYVQPMSTLRCHAICLINFMGSDFGKMVQKLTVTLNFIEPADRTRQIGILVGPQQESPDLKLFEKIGKELHIFVQTIIRLFDERDTYRA